MGNLRIEGETFEAPFVPLSPITRRPGVFVDVKFHEVPDSLEYSLKQEEEILWEKKVEDAKERGQVLTRGFQYGFTPDDAKSLADSFKFDIPVAQITYSRIELAKKENRRNIPNVLGLSEILYGPKGYLFVERGGKVAYYGGTGQFHALVSGGFPRNLKPIKPKDMTIETWLEAQQQTEHAILPSEVFAREFLGIVLDKALGYKPELLFTAQTKVTKEKLAERFPEDAFERKGVIEFWRRAKSLTRAILAHRELERHVPPGFGGAIIELARIGGIESLDALNYEAKKHGGPLIEYGVRNR